ncbi:hypothetical protein FOA43_000394 [Brettanomyces nanus]|uniref:Dynein heavy chain, cytoplasmic n=1 Tax=Eeniella nana TaxID=13502 RepID=A0A875RZK3_EENNA|nr:uncharacterized protein FOA43_000394 [Brettanomyces nanus]QPG73089.1 hypothetical protein FOA43_000394 [Brettanomyces nanus]
MIQSEMTSEESESLNTSENHLKVCAIDPDQLIRYIRPVISSLLNVSIEKLTLSTNSTLISEFISSPNERSLYMVRSANDFAILEELTVSPATYSSIVIIAKSQGTIVQERPIEDQLLISELPLEGSAYSENLNKLRCIMSSVVSTYFDVITSAHLNDQLYGTSTPISVAKKKISELISSLEHLQQVVQTPNLLLTADPIVKTLVAENDDIDVIANAHPQLLADSSFLNRLQSIAGDWVKQIQNLVSLSYDLTHGTASEEVKFWESKELALRSVENELQDPVVLLTLRLLKDTKRFHGGSRLLSDSGIRNSLTTTSKYNQLLRDLPIGELTSSRDLVKIKEAIIAIFNHIKKLKVIQYPIDRAVLLVQVITIEANDRILEILKQMKLMDTSYNEFTQINLQACGVLEVIKECIKKFTVLARELLRKRSERFMVVKVENSDCLRERLDKIKGIRDEYEEISISIHQLSKSMKIDVGTLLSGVYDVLINDDLLDITRAGKRRFASIVGVYTEMIEAVEYKIADKLRDALKLSFSNTNEMFTIFRDFDFLLKRPSIRNSVQDYQDQLVNHLQADLQSLESQFDLRQQSWRILQLRNLPPFTANLVWIQQIQVGIQELIEKLEVALTKDWILYPEGKKIGAQLDLISGKLNIQGIFNDWAHRAIDHLRSPIMNERILIVQKMDKWLRIEVNFDNQSVNLSDEVDSLETLGFSVPRSVHSYAQQLVFIYPYTINLLQSVAGYENMMEQVDSLGELTVLMKPLLEPALSSVKILLKECWSNIYKAHDLISSNITDVDEVRTLKTVEALGPEIVSITRKFELLQNIRPSFVNTLQKFNSVDYDKQCIASLIISVQKLVDTLVANGFQNIEELVHMLNETMTCMLIERCERRLDNLSREFSLDSHIHSIVPCVKHSILFHDLSIIVHPQLEFSKSRWIRLLNQNMEVITSQKLLTGKHYDVNVVASTRSLDNLLDITSRLSAKYNDIAVKIGQLFEVASRYTLQWIELQYLWELNFDDIEATIGSELTSWLDAFKDLTTSRNLVDTVDSKHLLGPLVIDYSLVQPRVNAQYDVWQRKMAQKLATVLGKRMSITNELITKLRQKLESVSVNFTSGSSTVCLCSLIYTTRRSLDNIEVALGTYKAGNDVLLQVRFKFPRDWVYFKQVSDNCSSFLELIDDRFGRVNSNKSIVCSRVQEKASELSGTVIQARKAWLGIINKLNIDVATSEIDKFERMFDELKHQREMIFNSTKLLGLDVIIDCDIGDVDCQVKKYKEIWSCIYALVGKISVIKSTSWEDFSPRTLRLALEDMLAFSRETPIRIRGYSAFSDIQSEIRGMIHVVPILASLKVDAMTFDHWNRIFENLKIMHVPEKLTLGDVLDLNPAKHIKFLRTVVQEAQSEKLLADSLKEIEESWSSITFELQPFGNDYLIVKSWGSLFDKVEADLNSLVSMKSSPLVGNYRETITILENKIGKLHDILDIWVVLQKDWIYLFGIFQKNEDIRRLLTIESTRFDTVTSELYLILRSAYRVKSVLDVITVPGIAHTFEKTLQVFSKTKKSLSGYLEKQRELFPRFYFVGNDNLLEVVGNASNVGVASRHINKMFPGISSLEYDSDRSMIIGIVSPEYEHVLLHASITITHPCSASDWLSSLEIAIKKTIFHLLVPSLKKLNTLWEDTKETLFLSWLKNLPNQILLVSLQVLWTSLTEAAIANGNGLKSLAVKYDELLILLAKLVFEKLTALEQLKLENVTVEALHQRQALEELLSAKDVSLLSFSWISQQRYYFDSEHRDFLESLVVKQGNASFFYGFEYLGCPRKLIYTPLVNNSFCAMTEALNQNFGASLSGPAGTGKTESVKALGQNLGLMVLVFCCDETFDFYAVTRILVGVCRTGSWGCFDEFNRLTEEMLSAMSTQIEKIEGFLGSDGSEEIDLLGKKLKVNKKAGIFITSNPAYAGRSNLPDNLKSKYRSFAVVRPDTLVIAEAILISQGFVHAKYLAPRAVSVFADLESKSSKQSHYDFGLRALKATLLNCGKIKRLHKGKDGINHGQTFESQIIVKGMHNIVLPRLIPQDEPVFFDSIEVFDIEYNAFDANEELIKDIGLAAERMSIQTDDKWLSKCLQLYEIWKAHQGFIMVGKPGSGKTIMLKCLMQALKESTGSENLWYTIDPKALTKEELYGSLDYATNDWTDGVLTSIIRSVNENVRGESTKNVWIILDGDIDPVWVENLNSVLDDNKILTLPNGERLIVPDNLRLVFEVERLDYATPATISRCGVVWFADSMFDLAGNYAVLVHEFQHSFIDNEEAYNSKLIQAGLSVAELKTNFAKNICSVISSEILQNIWNFSKSYEHVMASDLMRCLETFMVLLSRKFHLFLDFLVENISLSNEDYSEVFLKMAVVSLAWAFAGDIGLNDRKQFCNQLISLYPLIRLKDSLNGSLVYTDVSFETSGWIDFQSRVPIISLEPQMVIQPDTVIPTLDTVRTEDLIFSLLEQHRNVVLSGPPGAGKTMLLMSALRRSTKFDFTGINFSKETSPGIVLKTLEQHCVYKSGPNGVVLQPSNPDKWMVVFCDEINLPSSDRFGTQKVIAFLRQLIVRHGFWRSRKNDWVHISRIQFVGACNPPTDPGRNKLSDRFLRHTSVLMVDYPGEESLKQIYTTFNKALLKMVPDLQAYADALTTAMLEVYGRFRIKFDRKVRAHYICSPRELTRWVRGMFHSIQNSTSLTVDGLIRLWAYEALRLFSDKLEFKEDRNWTLSMITDVASECFPYADLSIVLRQPIMYSDWLSFSYQSVNIVELSKFVDGRLRVFCEEEANCSLVLHGDMLEHILKIDRALKNSQGHLILVGPSGSGKTTLTRFVSWMNGFKVFSLSVSRNYSLEDFDKTLKELMIRTGSKGEKLCFIIDESTILESAFLERMNTLLANAEIPGLFEGDEYSSLMETVSRASQEAGLYLSSDEELYQWFTQQVSANLHVVFTMSNPYLPNAPRIFSSPALFNRCVLIWMGNWSAGSLLTVASGFLEKLPLDKSDYEPPKNSTFKSYRNAVVNALIDAYTSMNLHRNNSQLSIQASPLKFISLMKNFSKIFIQKEGELMQYHRHIQIGLDRLKETLLSVKDLNRSLQAKKEELDQKDQEAQQMLDKMLTEQNEAERKEEASMEIRALLESQDKKIKERRETVYLELSEVEPLIEEASRGVKNIKKQHLTEMRSMNNPPEAIKLTLESVCVFLGFDVRTWRDVQNVIRKDDFIARIVEYDTERQFSKELGGYMNKHYMSNSIYNYESVNRASKACGPLLLWIQAQLRYAMILEKVEPLRKEMKHVEKSSLETKNKLIAIDGMVADLRESIKDSKLKYSQLIRDTENIKTLMSNVKLKVAHSIRLLESLSDERTRWQSSIVEFEQQRQDLIGNVILVACFMTFAGPHNEKVRQSLWTTWMSKLTKLNINFDQYLSFTRSIANVGEVLKWERMGLPNDDLFMENVAGITSEVSDGYAFIIDPTGLMIDFLEKYTVPKKLVITSFLDKDYLGQLKNCVRFGGSILILDAEYYDPAINRVISYDTQLTGGRVLVRIAGESVDMSPDFKLYLHTKDPSIQIIAFVASRMNVFNFTFTATSLVKHGMNMTLKSERPELNKKRLDSIMANSELKQKLEGLETDLLELLNNATESILDDAELTKKLELIKKESSTIKFKIAESKNIFNEVSEITDSYQSLARLYTFFCLMVAELWKLNLVYLFSDNYVTSILQEVLAIHKGKTIDTITLQFVKRIYSCLSISLLQVDRPLLGLLVYNFYRNCLYNPNHEERRFVTEGDDELCGLANDYSRLVRDDATVRLPDVGVQSFEDAINKSSLFVLRALEGFASFKVISHGKSVGKQVVTYSVGSNDSLEVATKLLKEACKKDQWVVIENVDLSNELLDLIPKLYDSLRKHKDFKLFLACSVNAKLTNILCKMSKQVVFETAPGVRLILEDGLLAKDGALSILQDSLTPESKKIYFLLAWLYSVLKERLRFVPIGFEKSYEFNEYDLAFSKVFIDESLANCEKILGTAVTIDTIPFDWIARFIGRIVFGGKIDKNSDLQFVTSLANKVLSLDCFEGRSNLLLTNSYDLRSPNDDFKGFISKLPEVEPVAWVGLPENADLVLKQKQCKRVFDKAKMLFEEVVGVI